MAIHEPLLTLEQTAKAIQAEISALSNTRTVSIQLYMVGSVRKEGTKSTYQAIEPHEVVIDGEVADWLFNGVC